MTEQSNNQEIVEAALDAFSIRNEPEIGKVRAFSVVKFKDSLTKRGLQITKSPDQTQTPESEGV